jgi:hypothetical protein
MVNEIRVAPPLPSFSWHLPLFTYFSIGGGGYSGVQRRLAGSGADISFLIFLFFVRTTKQLPRAVCPYRLLASSPLLFSLCVLKNARQTTLPCV